MGGKETVFTFPKITGHYLSEIRFKDEFIAFWKYCDAVLLKVTEIVVPICYW